MKQDYTKPLLGIALMGLFMFTSCHSTRGVAGAPAQIVQTEGSMISMNDRWDAAPDARAVALLKPYKAKIDSMMYEVIGVSTQTMEKGKPESELSNLVAEVLRQAAVETQGKPADMGLVNMGGLRNILPAGDITVGTVYEILPFENSLCVVTLKGVYLKELLTAIASLGGEGVSGVRMKIKGQECVDALVDGQPIEDDKLYTVATIDYLADGNGSMTALTKGEKRDCPEGATLRGLFLDYVKKQTAAGHQITSEKDGRIENLTPAPSSKGRGEKN